MANQALVDYFIEGKKKGFTSEQLKDSLIKQGYTINEIGEALLNSLREKQSFFSTHVFKLSLIIILLLIIVISFYVVLSKFNILGDREISGVHESYVNKILREECSGIKGQQYAECSTDVIANIAFNYNNEKLCGFSKFESICIDKFRSRN